MIEYIERAIDLVRERNQYKTPNLLTAEIQDALILNESQAIDTAKKICKVLTFWVEGFSKDLIDMDFTEFYKHCIDQKYIVQDSKGLYVWMALSFEDMAEKFDIEVNTIDNFRAFTKYKNKDEFLGVIRIKSASGGKHSIITYRNSGNKLKISDTYRRGIDVNFFDYITEDNFLYFNEMEL